jgi:hypothetical protein
MARFEEFKAEETRQLKAERKQMATHQKSSAEREKRCACATESLLYG